MSPLNHRARKAGPVRRSVVATLMIAMMACPLTPAQAEVSGTRVRRLVDSAVDLLRKPKESLGGTSLNRKPQVATTPAQRAAEITHFRLCPRRLSLYVGEDYTLVPIALDRNREIVHGVAYEWQTNNAGVATVSGGTVEAVAPGLAVLTVSIGTARATVAVVVLPGARRRLSDVEWDIEHASDCTNPESVAVTETDLKIAEANQLRLAQQASAFDETNTEEPSDLARLAKPAVMRRGTSRTHLAAKAASASFARHTKNADPPTVAAQGGPPPLIDGEGDDPPVSQATSYFANAIGSPRFSPQEAAMGSASKTKNNLGSYNYSFAAPVVGLPGRGINLNLAMIYNSRVWSLDNGAMTFNYNKGWPAAGWSLGYGRLIEKYDGVNWLLLGPDGTRTHLDKALGQSTDGSFISINSGNGKVRYPDGTLVDFDVWENRWLPTKIRTANGQKITIGYKAYIKNQSDPNYFPFRWAIAWIQDTVGRYIYFNYDPTSKYLSSVTAPDQGGGTRTLVQISYQTIFLQYNFSAGLLVNAPASGSQLDVVQRIYYPQTGRGYLFTDYSSYGMARKISTRIGMFPNGAGTEVAYTNYNYVDVSTQVGQLNDAPQYTTRSEWWQDKTDSNGNATTAATDYTYTRSAGTDNGFVTEIDTVQNNDSNLKIVTTTGNDSENAPDSFGHVISTEYKDLSNASLQKTSYSYSGGQLISVTSVVDGGQQAKTTYDYGNYGRVATVDEYGFSASIQRRTSYEYLGGPTYVDSAWLLRLVNHVTFYDGGDLTTPVAKTDFTYDDYGPTGGMLSPSPLPPNHEPGFTTSVTNRGNVTAVTLWVNAGTPGSSLPPRYTQYDIFGNVRRADVSCCKSKSFSFSDDPMHYSQADSVTDGTPGTAPFLTTSFAYNWNTGLLLSTTDPQNRTTSFIYDNAWRLTTVTAPQNAFTTTTQFDKDFSNNDLLAYSQKTVYTDTDGIQKTVWSKSWFDGAGRVIRAGTGQGSTPANFDAVKTLYDPVGRVLKQSNPYIGDASGNGLPAYWTVNTYDPLSRVKVVTLPDLQTIQTTYNSTIVTVTDQVGRKRQSQVDGLGRLISVTEQHPATGILSLVTNYTYNTLDNLTGVNQGGQTRSFAYDSLSRLTSQTTPEGGAVNFTYTDFGAVLKRIDPRNVETHYKYDTLNRPMQVWYTGLGGDDAGSVRPALPSGVAATSDVTIIYKTASPGNGEVDLVKDGAGTESYVYDSLGRATSKTRAIDGNSYTTGYQYNAINQLSVITYPSNKQVRQNHDMRGRLSGFDKLSGGVFVSSYLSGVAYNSAAQVTGLTDGSGVVENYTYSNDRLQLTRQTATKSTTTLMDLNYSYSAAAGASGVGTSAGNSGQLMAITNNPSNQPSTINTQNRNQTFTYDDLGRLVTATGWNIWQRRFAYDRWGNRTGVWDATSGGNQIQSVVLQMSGGAPTNRISSITDTGVPSTQTYDASGNLIGDGTHTYQYDGEGRIATVDATGAAYSYDSANRRVKKVVGNTTLYYIWEGAQVIAEYSNAAAGAGGTSYYLADRLSTRMITDTNGGYKGTQDHLPFGDDAGTSTGQIEKHRFTTYERDTESGTDYAINRQHQYANGRFTQPDPIDGDPDFPQTLNRYSYTANDPINLSDPLGLEFGAQNQGVCPPEFQSCVDVDIPGIGRVMVGLDGLGGGTFIWGNSILTDRQLSRFNELFGGLPKTFLINPSLEQMLDTREHPSVRRAKDQIFKRFRAELQKCDEGAAQTFQQYLRDNKVDIRQLQARANAWKAATGVQGAVQLGRALISVSPPGIAFNALSTFGVIPDIGDLVTWQDLLYPNEIKILNDAQAAAKRDRKSCIKNVRRKFGI